MARPENRNIVWCKENGIYQRLRKARESAHMSRAQAVDAIDCDPKTVYDCEMGYAVPRLEYMQKAAIAYGVSMDWLFGLTDKMVRYDKLELDIQGTLIAAAKIQDTAKKLEWIINRVR